MTWMSSTLDLLPRAPALTSYKPRRRGRPRKPAKTEAPLFAPEVIAAERMRRQARVELDMHRRVSAGQVLVGQGVLDEPPAVLDPAEVAALLTGLHDQLAANTTEAAGA